MNKDYQQGEKIVFIPDNKTYDFGYYSQVEGKCVIYNEGERNMQDSFAVDIDKIRAVKTNPPMTERERNKRLLLLLDHLIAKDDQEAKDQIELLGTMLDTNSMKKTYEIMVEGTKLNKL